ncbi:MAG: hypothetical protein HYX69_21570 [Planctomycetia bacterium]|nr:hypothetical protein [Planctomycetia bacterium]
MFVTNARWHAVACLSLACLGMAVRGDAAPKPVPKSAYMGVANGYAETMVKQGRDAQGPQRTGLFLSVLDRATLAVPTERPAAPAGVPESLRAGAAGGPLAGADPAHDENLLRLLYFLAEMSSKPAYRNAADDELKWFLNLPAADTRLAAWDAGAAWNVMTDSLMHGDGARRQGVARPWMLWDRSFELAPEASKRLVMGLREASLDSQMSPRSAGFAIRAFAAAYQHTGDEAFLKAIEAVLEQLEAKAGAQDGAPAARWLSVAIDCSGAAGRVPLPLATRLRNLAANVDQKFRALPHDLAGKGGFALTAAGKPDKPAAPTSLWQVGPDGYTTAGVAMMCVSRYENTASVDYRALVHAAADAYRDSLPGDDVDVWPMTFGQAISLELAAWRSASRQEYLDRAIMLADVAVQTFWGDNPLPRASSQSRHYESVTGADTLALSLMELHLSILHITAVRCPPNTIDR